MKLTGDERTLLMLYYSTARTGTIQALKEMQACLMPDEDYSRLELFSETDSPGGAHVDKR